MKILFVITGLGVGGAEMQVVGLADALVRMGHQVRIVSLTGKADVKPASTEVRIDSFEMSKSPFGFLLAARKLSRVIKLYGPDVVHSHMVHANLLTRITRLIQPMVRLISTAHSNNEGGKVRMLAYRCTDFLADISTNVSETAVSDFVRAGAVRPGRMLAIYNGIDLNRFKPVPSCRVSDPVRRKILAVGRFHPQKDYACLIKAVALLRGGNDPLDFVLEIAGEGPERSLIEKMAVEYGLKDCVKFLGLRQDIPSLMQSTDVFVLSSISEGFGLVVAEAMACEKVVVATDCGGVKEVLDGNGYLVQAGSPKALASALRSALTIDSREALELGKAARKHVLQMFSMDNVASHWVSIYEARNLNR